MKRKLLVATHNQGKIAEFAEMLADLEIEWLSLADVNVTRDVEETGATFYENALLKATAYAAETGLLTLADDSGLEVDALDGAPGVYTARYGGEGLSHEERYHFLLKNMRDVPIGKRNGRFRCTIILASPTGELLGSSEGICEGQIALEAVGEGGFGYDPIFYLPEWDKTMAQMGAAKHQISHRGRALQGIESRLRELLG